MIGLDRGCLLNFVCSINNMSCEASVPLFFLHETGLCFVQLHACSNKLELDGWDSILCESLKELSCK